MLKLLVMKKIINISILTLSLTFAMVSCKNDKKTSGESTPDVATTTGGQEAVKDDVSAKDIVKIAVGSKDHTTLVAALQQADYVKVLANAGPFTVFAPTNAAFDKLPAGTVDGLMKVDKKDDLRNILEYHVAVGVYKQENMQDGQKINMVNLDDITLSVKDGKLMVNGTANVVATIPASNGIIYVIDAVLLPPAK
jgi:uncharacterized surface protein with fasciclin (FAS1) repeats